MCSIGIQFLNTDFEHDIFELIRAFYPEAVFNISYEDDDPPECDLLFRVKTEGGQYSVFYQKNDMSGVFYAGDIKGQTGQTGQTGRNALLMRERKESKDSIKYELYHVLERLSGRSLPWGNLTGIRPAKLAMAMLEEGKSNPEIAEEMRKRYLVSPKKAALAVAIANRENHILKDIDYKNGYSLYVGIPFCPSICLYCSFSSYPLSRWKKQVDDYLDALIREIWAVSSFMKETGRHLDTIYIGGGTPTTLEPDQIRRLLSELQKAFPMEEIMEFTVEAGRPDSITREKLLALRSFPVTRISVNPQTMNQETLDIIGRKHTVAETRKAFYAARELGFDDINMDLIIGLPGEDLDAVKHTLSEVSALAPDSMTVHSLAVKRAARLNMFRDQYKEMTFENSQEILDETMKAAYAMDMSPYYLYRQKNMKGNFENVGYSRADKAGIYNILIMEEREPIIALGAGGASKIVVPGSERIERVENVKDVANYIERIDEMIERKRAGIGRWLMGRTSQPEGHEQL